jgi:hypothetical protein
MSALSMKQGLIGRRDDERQEGNQTLDPFITCEASHVPTKSSGCMCFRERDSRRGLLRTLTVCTRLISIRIVVFGSDSKEGSKSKRG